MLCCAAGVAAVATGAIGWRRFRRFLCGRLNAQSLLAAGAAAVVAITVIGLAVEHVRHHAAHARGIDTALITDPGAPPLCRGGAPADRIADIARIEE
jgi:hypothetical protein